MSLAQHRSGRLTGNRLSLVLPGGPQAASEARSALRLLARELAPDLFQGLRLLVSELVTNSVKHGGAGPDDLIRLEVVASAGGVRAEVADLGPGFEVRPPAPARHGEGGWGLVIVERVAARWGADEGGRRVWFDLEPNGQGRDGGRLSGDRAD
jgi:anti-sigma regulatory factor (Ser/Thr protein kinase)